MAEKREFKWTKDTRRENAERTKAAALDIISQEQRISCDKVARLKALRLARESQQSERAEP